MEATEVKIDNEQLQTAWNGYVAAYQGDWGLKASEEDAVFSMLQAVWPDKYAKADFVAAMRDDARIARAVEIVYDLNNSDPWNGSEEDAKRFISDVLGVVIGQIGFKAGDRIELTEWVERFPSFQVAPGATGVVTSSEDTLLCVKMDEPIAGCEEWDNVVQFVLPEEAAEVLHVKVVS